MRKEKIRNKIKLKDIANISSGLVLNRIDHSRSIANKTNKYFYISQKSVHDNYIDDNRFEPIATDKAIESRYLAHYGDIIMKLTPSYDVAVVDFKRDDVAIPSNFAIIRIKDDEYIPSFLAYILNGKKVKKQLKRLIEGSNVPVIKINHLNNIVIEKRAKNKQIMYSKLFSFLDSRRRLLDRKRELEDSLKNNILSKL